MSIIRINIFKKISLLKCIVGLTIFSPMPILATVADLSVATNPSLSIKNTLIAQTPQVFCDVINIKTGQLALRFTPGGEARAGLNNGNVVKLLKDHHSPWVYVQVMQVPNPRVNGLTGWVNSNYLSCYIVYLSIIPTSMTALARQPKAVEPRVDENGIITYDYPGYFYEYSWLSQKKIKKEADLEGYSALSLDLLRNAIFAVHGRRFVNPTLQNYFNSQPWYKPRYQPNQFPSRLLTPIEQHNVDMILRYQKRTGLRYF